MLKEKPMATTEPRPTRTENGANGNGAAGATQKIRQVEAAYAWQAPE